jgi:hypothetical protein
VCQKKKAKNENHPFVKTEISFMEKTFYGLLGLFNLLPWFCAILALSRGEGGVYKRRNCLGIYLGIIF